MGINLNEDCMKSLCTLGIGAGAFAFGLGGFQVLNGMSEMLAGGSNFLLDLTKEQEDTQKKIQKQVIASIDKENKNWLKAIRSGQWSGGGGYETSLADVDDALKILPIEVASLKFDPNTMVSGQLDAQNYLNLIYSALPENSKFITNQNYKTVLGKVILGIYSAIQNEPKMRPLFDSLFQKRMMEEISDAKQQRGANHQEVLDAIYKNTGIPIARLKSLFEALEEEFPDEDIDTKLVEAIDRIRQLTKQHVEIKNVAPDIRMLLEQANANLKQTLDVKVATKAFDAIFEDAEMRMKDAAILAYQKANMYVAVFEFDEAIGVFELAAKYDPDDPWPWFEIGDIRVSRGNLAKANDAYENAQKIAIETGDERDLSVSYNKLGDVSVALGELSSAQKSYASGLEIRESLSNRDPSNSAWQRDLSVSYNKFGDVSVALGELSLAQKSYASGLEIRESLSNRDPSNTEWQRDLIVSNVKLANVGDKPVERLEAALEIAVSLKKDGRMQPIDYPMIETIEGMIANAKDG